MIVVALQTKPSGLYRHRRGLGLHRVGYREGDLHPNHQAFLPRKGESHPDTGRSIQSCILYLHSPTVRPKYIVRLSGYPLIQESLTNDTARVHPEEVSAKTVAMWLTSITGNKDNPRGARRVVPFSDGNPPDKVRLLRPTAFEHTF